MRLLVCGHTDFFDSVHVGQSLDAFHARHPVTAVVAPEIAGPSTYARMWGKRNGLPVETFKPNWKLGARAGPMLNRQMLSHGKPDYVIAFATQVFDNKSGVQHMLTIARKAGLPTMVVGLPELPLGLPAQ